MKLQATPIGADTHVATGDDVLARCYRAKQLEVDGNYGAALEALGDLCPSIGMRPDVASLPPEMQAEVLLRVGSICGWVGSANQIQHSQDFAKDLISESRRLFEQVGLRERVAEASNDLAICYWREGAFDEARATLRHALSLVENSDSEIKLRALLNLGLVERSSMRLKDALEVNRQAAKAFEQSTNHSLVGKFHNEYATVLKNIGVAESREDLIDQALVEYAASSFHLELAGNTRTLASIENNQGFLFASIGRFEEAHKHLNRARSLFLATDDRGRVAEVDDTRARVLLLENKPQEAEVVARNSVRTLVRGDERSLLAASLITHGTALARLARREEARLAFRRAVDIAERSGDLETAGNAALTMVEELHEYLAIEAKQYYLRSEGLLAKSQDDRIKQRLGACARRILERETRTSPATNFPFDTPTPKELPELTGRYSLEERVLNYEAQIIKRALEAADGSVTKAARLLNITHQGLAFILNGRQKNLLAVRTPVKQRRRSIIRNRSAKTK
jgi:tetratricopeptide (TPR) repeat protein